MISKINVLYVETSKPYLIAKVIQKEVSKNILKLIITCGIMSILLAIFSGKIKMILMEFRVTLKPSSKKMIPVGSHSIKHENYQMRIRTIIRYRKNK